MSAITDELDRLIARYEQDERDYRSMGSANLERIAAAQVTALREARMLMLAAWMEQEEEYMNKESRT